MASAFENLGPKQVAPYGNLLRDEILQRQINDEVAQKIKVVAGNQISDDETSVVLQLYSKSGQLLSTSDPIAVSVLGNKVIESVELTTRIHSTTGELEKILRFHYKDSSITPMDCSIDEIYQKIADNGTLIAAETARAKAQENQVQANLTTEAARALAAETAINLNLATNYLAVKYINFTLGADDSLTANYTPAEVKNELSKTLFAGKLISGTTEIPVGICTAGLYKVSGGFVSLPIFAAGSGQYEIIGDLATNTWHFNQ